MGEHACEPAVPVICFACGCEDPLHFLSFYYISPARAWGPLASSPHQGGG